MMARFTLSRLLPRLLSVVALCAVVATAALAQPSNPVKLLKGVVSDARSGKPVDGGRVFVYQGSKSEPVAQSRINPSTGAFQVVLGPSTDYRFVIRSNRFLPGESTLRTPDGSNYEEFSRNLTVQPIPVGETIFSGRLFEPNASVLTSTGDLTKALAFMKESRAATVKITVIPDMPAAKAAAKKAPAPKGKKGKKGAAAVEETPAPAATGTGDDRIKTLGQERLQAIKAMMQREGISLTRIKWEVPANAADLKAYAGRKENVVITISGVDVGEVEEEDNE